MADPLSISFNDTVILARKKLKNIQISTRYLDESSHIRDNKTKYEHAKMRFNHIAKQHRKETKGHNSRNLCSTGGIDAYCRLYLLKKADFKQFLI